MTYLINLLFVPIYYIFIKALAGSKKKTRRPFFIVVTIHAVLFRALANPFNYVDTENYAENFLQISDLSFNDAVLSINIHSSWGQGYVALNWLIGQFTTEPLCLFMVLAIMSVGGVIWFYYKTTYTPLNTMLFYLLYPMMYLMGFGVIRQHLSIMFLLIALYYIDKLKYSIPLAILGVLFHTSSLVFFPFFFIYRINLLEINVKKLSLFVIIGIILISSGIMYILNLSERYLAVFEKTGNETNLVPVVIIGSMIFMLFWTKAIHRISERHDKQIVNLLIYGLVIALFSTSVPSAGRLTLLFIYIIPVVLSMLYNYGNHNMLPFVNLYSFMLYMLTILMISMSYLSQGGFMPYSLIWNS